jgi:hypothetical protein
MRGNRQAWERDHAALKVAVRKGKIAVSEGSQIRYSFLKFGRREDIR